MVLFQFSKGILSEFGSDGPAGIRHDRGQQPAGHHSQRDSSRQGGDVPRKRSIVSHTVQGTVAWRLSFVCSEESRLTCCYGGKRAKVRQTAPTSRAAQSDASRFPQDRRISTL